ncbi:sigma-70 family RNA polymerase sigma factor [Gracilibacillus sp. YIM 98692]|uniref:sigma-70 family RNA polymerase sigma factor n=1 Tax=Gracilibacillus sp. YIM 98692 TaxID=2663532 RepID=UPI001F09A820|nr:sigma-70 family RNA polymerase sigma factor [Gracilibacillus sp. YIM 98692]
MKECVFDEVLEKHERIIFHLIHKYGIRDADGEFYQEGCIALWRAWEEHDASLSRFSTYAYYAVSRTFLDKIRKDNRKLEQYRDWMQRMRVDDAVREDVLGMDERVLAEIRKVLTERQWVWFEQYVLRERSLPEIAESEGVSVHAVKNWGRLAREKLKRLLVRVGYV